MALNLTSSCQPQREEISFAISIPEEVPRFNISQETLANIVELHNTDSKPFHEANFSCGGFLEVVNALKSDIHNGLEGDNIDDLSQRIKVFGSNHFSLKERDCNLTEEKSFYGLPFKALKETSIVLLLCCAMLSLAIGIKKNGPREGISYGLVLFISIFIFVNIRFVCKYFNEKWLAKEHIHKHEMKVEVLRNGELQRIEAYKIVVGDVLSLKTGDKVPVDGLLIDIEEPLTLDNTSNWERFKYHKHCSVFEGENVILGCCRMLVTAVGDNTERQKLIRSLAMCPKNESSKLHIDIEKLNSELQKIMLGLSLFMLVIQFSRCFLWKSGCTKSYNPDSKGLKNAVEEIMTESTKAIKRKGMPVNRLVSMLCIMVFSMRDGFPFGIFISLAYASKTFLSQGFLIQELEACATIGLVNTICVEITNDLVLQPLKMAELWIGFEMIKDPMEENILIQVLDTFREGIGLEMYCLGEFALSFWAERVLGVKIGTVKTNCRILSIKSFDQEKDLIGFFITRNGEDSKGIHMHWRGSPNRVLAMCSHYYGIDGTMQTLDQDSLARFYRMIEEVGSRSLKCLAFAYKRVCLQEKEEEDIENNMGAPQHGITLLGLIFLNNPYSTEVMNNVRFCNDFGVKIKLMAGDEVEKSRFMATNSGILKPNDEGGKTEGTLIDAIDFRVCAKEKQMRIIDKFQVMAGCSPSDRLRVVQFLKERGEVVAALVKSSRDSVTLEQADLGFFWGENNNCKENADIILPDMKFSDICSILKLGACVFKNLQKFMQLQLTINICAFTINFIVGILSNEVPLGPFQLLWVNMVMDSFGAVALGEIDEMAQLNNIKKPRPCLINKSMWVHIASQCLYQVLAFLMLIFGGKSILKVDQKVIKTMVFNCFMICQIFGMINAKGFEMKNMFKVMVRKRELTFVVCIGVIFMLQLAVVETTSLICHSKRLHFKHWCICTGIGAISLPIGWIVEWGCLICML